MLFLYTSGELAQLNIAVAFRLKVGDWRRRP